MKNQRFDPLVESVYLMDTLSEGLVLLDDEQRVIAVNRSGAAYLRLLAPVEIGARLTHLSGQPIQTVLAPLPAGAPNHEIIIEQPSHHIFEVIAYPIQSGEVWLLVLLDRTELRQLQALAQQQDRLAVVGQLAAGIAHDFNNILTPMILYTDQVMSHLPPDSGERSMLQQVLCSARRAKELVLQILTFCQQAEPPRRVIRLQPILEEVLQLLRGILPATIEIRQHINLEVGFVLAEPTHIFQILMNLGTNAYHAMRTHGGVLTVSLDVVQIDASSIVKHAQLKEGTYVRLTVSDTGHGMGSATMQHIFEPFFTTKRMGEGTGMGLSIVYGIVNSYAGTITVDSKPSEGTAFCIYLPQVDGRVEMKEDVEQPVPRGGEHILVVDDEQVIALVTKAILENLGCAVTAQTNSVEALAIFRAAPESFDLVITDLSMVRLTGTELVAELRHLRPDLPIVLITGTGDVPTPDFVKAVGARAYLQKPFSASDLSRMVRHVLDEG
jgi:signal transduction histidine kinase/CheY-like chemotaxis protein